MSKRGNRIVLVERKGKYQSLLKKYNKTVAKLEEKTCEIEVLKWQVEVRDSRIEELENIVKEKNSEIEGRDSRIEELENIVKEKNSEIRELQHNLAYLDNPNTPPSAKQPGSKGKKNKNKKNKPNNSKRKRGAQQNHKGTTNKPKPTIMARHIPTKCYNCNNKNLNLVKCDTRNITNIQVTVTTAKHEFYEGHCSCGACTEPPDQPTSLQWIPVDGDVQETSEAAPSSGSQDEMSTECVQETSEAVPVSHKMQDVPHEDIPANVAQCVSQKLPKRGEYGLGVVLLVILNFLDRLPFRLNSRALGRWDVGMSSGTVHNIMSSTGMDLAAPAADILRRIRSAYVLNVDETSISLNGKRVWVWIFHNPETGDTYFVVRPSRGSDVVKEVLGKNWKGRLVCDGWTAYSKYRKQRCWAHIFTAIQHVVDRNPQCAKAQEVQDALSEIYEIGCGVTGSAKERRRVRALLDKRVRRLVLKYGDVPELKRFITRLSNARPNLFHFVTDPRIPPTNNAAERGLREIVVHRKIRGSIRAESTMTWMGNLFSCVSTWLQHKMDVSAELTKYI